MSVVTYDLSDNIAVIAINRPEKRNALSVAVVEELAQAWRRFNVGDDRVAVLTATGDQNFTVGADLNDIPHDLLRAVPGIGVEVEKPIVGAVAGWVVGGGFVLANQCDLLVAADNATFLYPVSRGVGGAFAAEWRQILFDRGAFAMAVMAPIIYGLYYPQPYLTQILDKIPIAVVDNDLSQLSRDIIDKVDATSTLSVAVRAPTLAAARQSLDRGEVFAVLGVPPGTQRDVLKGNDVSVPVYVDATYLFIFRSTASSIAAAIGSVSSDLATRGVARGRTQHD